MRNLAYNHARNKTQLNHGRDCHCLYCKKNKADSAMELELDLFGEDFDSTNEFLEPDEILRGDEIEEEVSKKSRAYVQWVQQTLNKVLNINLKIDGKSGKQTRSAIRSFQKRFALAVDGIVGSRTEAMLIMLSFSSPPVSSNPSSSSSTGTTSGPIPAVNVRMLSALGLHVRKNQFGLPETIKALIEIGKRWQAKHPNGPQIRIADISRFGGGEYREHGSHRMGIDVDIGLMRKDGRNKKVNFKTDPNLYSRPLTQEMINTIQANKILKVHRLWFNDSQVSNINPDNKNGPFHNNHVHVRFCLPSKYNLGAMKRAAFPIKGTKGTYASC